MINSRFEEVKKSYSEFKNLFIDATKEFKNKDTRKKQIPNILTASRLFSPLFIIPSALTGNLLLTAIFTGLFATTDMFDGLLARKYNYSSEFGKRLDAIADKVFASSLLIPITILNPIMLINLGLEGVIASINVNSQIKNKSPKTNYIGKIKTWFLYSSIILGYLGAIVNINNILFNSFISITAALQVSAGIKYYKEYKKEESDIEIKKEQVKPKVEKALKELEEVKKLKEYKNYIINKQQENNIPEKEKIYTKIKTP